MIFLPFIPIVALIIQNSTLLSSVVFALSEAHEIQHQVNKYAFFIISHVELETAELNYASSKHYIFLQINLTVEATTIIQALQAERGSTAFYIFTNGSR